MTSFFTLWRISRFAKKCFPHLDRNNICCVCDINANRLNIPETSFSRVKGLSRFEVLFCCWSTIELYHLRLFWISIFGMCWTDWCKVREMSFLVRTRLTDYSCVFVFEGQNAGWWQMKAGMFADWEHLMVRVIGGTHKYQYQTRPLNPPTQGRSVLL